MVWMMMMMMKEGSRGAVPRAGGWRGVIMSLWEVVRRVTTQERIIMLVPIPYQPIVFIR